jgi:hypothetical protein
MLRCFLLCRFAKNTLALWRSRRVFSALWGSHWQGSFSTMVFNIFQA